MLHDLWAEIETLPHHQQPSFSMELNSCQVSFIQKLYDKRISLLGINPDHIKTTLDHLDTTKSLHLYLNGELSEIQTLVGSPVSKNENSIVQADNNSERVFSKGPKSDRVLGVFVIREGKYAAAVVAEIILESVRISKQVGFDQFRVATQLIDENDSASHQAAIVLSNLRSKYRIPDPKHIRVEYAVNQPASILTGSSAGCAFELVASLALDTYGKNPAYENQLYQDVAITGRIDETGTVCPVEERTLEQKLSAVFFSRVKEFIVPEAQLDLVQRYREELRSRFPHRKLKLRGVTSIDEVMEYRGLVTTQKRTISSRVRQFFKEKSIYILSAIAFLMAFGFIVYWFGIVKNSSPDKLVLSDDQPFVSHIENRFGYPIWTPPEPGYGLIKAEDLPGRKIFLFGAPRSATDSLYGLVQSYDDKMNLLWQKQVTETLQYEASQIANHFNVRPVLIDDFDSDGNCEIVVEVGHNYFPRTVIIMTENGDILGRYYHAGSIRSIKVSEIIPDNSTKELIVTGVNNEYGSGILTVLNPFDLQGQSPQSDPHFKIRDKGINPGYAYIKFPPTIFQEGSYRDAARILSNRDGNLRVSLFNYPRAKGQDLVFYYFGQNLEVEFVGISDAYNRLQKEILGSVVHSDPDLISFFSKIEYWADGHWLKVPK